MEERKLTPWELIIEMYAIAGKDCRRQIEIHKELREICPGYVIAVDFDGVLFTEAWPGIGLPVVEDIVNVRELRRYGCKLILWTCREGDALKAALEKCFFWELCFDAVNQNLPAWQLRYGNDCRKVGADLYLDDRAVRVTNGFYPARQELKGES